MIRMGMMMTVMLLCASLIGGTAYADDSSDKLRKASDILDILADEDERDEKHRDGPGNSKNARDNHGQNKKK